MSFKTFIKRFSKSYIYGAGSSAILLVILEFIFFVSGLKLNSEIYLNILNSCITALIPICIFTVLIMQKGLDTFDLWVRRILCSLFSATCFTLIYYIFNVLNDIQKIIVAFLVSLAAQLIIACPVYIIMDHRNRNKIKAINAKLKENQ